MHAGLVRDITVTNSWALKYHWWELLQVSFLSWRKFCHHKCHFCRDESFVSTCILLSWQNTCFVMTKVCLLRQKFCRDKIMFVTIFVVATNIIFLMTNMSFVTTNTCLLRQKWYLCQLPPTILKGSRDSLAGDTVATVVEHAGLIRDVTYTNSWALKGSTHGRVFTTVKHRFSSSDWTRNLVKNCLFLKNQFLLIKPVMPFCFWSPLCVTALMNLPCS